MSKSRVEASPETLDRCLTDVQVGRAGIEASSSQFPEVAEPLKAMLETAERVRLELAPDEPERAFVDAGLARVLNRARVSPRRKARRPLRSLRPARWMWRPAYALAIVLLAALLLGGVGVVRASAQALPGGSLYGVKRAVEEAQLTLTLSPSGDASLMERYAEERLTEASILAAAGRSDGVATALGGYDEMIDRLTALAQVSGLEKGPGSLDQLQADLERHVEVLQSVRSHSPAAAREHLDQAIERTRHSQDVIEQLEQGGSPSDLAPGRQETPGDKGGKPTDDQGEEVERSPEPGGKVRTPGPPPRTQPEPTKHNKP